MSAACMRDCCPYKNYYGVGARVYTAGQQNNCKLRLAWPKFLRACMQLEDPNLTQKTGGRVSSPYLDFFCHQKNGGTNQIASFQIACLHKLFIGGLTACTLGMHALLHKY